jgi:predicted sulfurtransferase
MRFISLMAALVLFGLLMLMGCNSSESTKSVAMKVPSPPPVQAGDNARRITPEELKVEITKNDVVIIDVRGEAAYKTGHIKGARLIPAQDILAHVDELPRDKMIVTYCS